MRRLFERHLPWAIAVLILATSPVAGQNRRPMTMVDLLDTPNLSDPQLSPDGRHLVYVLAEADWDANRRTSHIWRIDIGATTRLYLSPREPHGWNELRHQLFKMNAELDWFEKYAVGREYVWEPVPEARRTPPTRPLP